MSAETKKQIAKYRKDVVRHNKGYDKPIPLRHVYKDKSDIERDDDTHNLF